MTPAHRLSLLTAEPTWRGRALSGRAVDLLAVLAGGEDAWTGDGALIAALWPDDPPTHPLRALHVVVSRARALVGEGVVERVGDGYRLALPVAAVDARDLADRAVRARASADASRWDRVLELTDDLPMPAEADADDVAPVADAAPLVVLRERAARHAWRARRDRALALEATGECERALPLLRAAARRDGSDEAVLAALMRAVSWTRSPAAALEIYEDHRRRLREQGAVPGPALRAAHEAVLAAENPVRRGLVPVPDHFLGREDDVAGVLGALSTHRLVTITGPGGVGKTTLARAVAARSRRPAVYAVALAEVDSGVDLLRAILNAVGSPLAADADPRAVVRAVLAPPGTLLILDNCEHLADEVADLVGPLLVGCPDLRVLATSRRRLDLGAEHVHRLEPLDAAAAAGLFRARALAARPDQVIDDGDLEALLGRVEGIPLAIELAAARTRTLSVGQIAARLPGRPGMLTGARDAPTRQRTLTAVIEWSWNLLDVSERHALARLALLADGFTLGAAEAVVGPEAPDLLDALVTHSLLIVRDRGLPRFHMLVTVRDVVLSRLADSGDEVRARRALRDWALEVCSQVRLPVGAGDFGDADHPQAERHDRVFRRLMDDEAVVLQELDRLLEQADGADAGVNADLRDAICLIGAALLRLWSVTGGMSALRATVRASSGSPPSRLGDCAAMRPASPFWPCVPRRGFCRRCPRRFAHPCAGPSTARGTWPPCGASCSLRPGSGLSSSRTASPGWLERRDDAWPPSWRMRAVPTPPWTSSRRSWTGSRALAWPASTCSSCRPTVSRSLCRWVATTGSWRRALARWRSSIGSCRPGAVAIGRRCVLNSSIARSASILVRRLPRSI